MDIDFGTYHHSTPEGSRNMRKKVEKAFEELFASVYPANAHIRILDAGCGLGFLISVAARYFPNAQITGIDVFNHESLSGATLEKAASNIRALGIDSRVELRKHDLTKPLDTGIMYDLAISNLVFHNLGKKRFAAYETVFSALREGAYFILEDLFPSLDKDRTYFANRCSVVNENISEGSGKWVYRIFLLKKR